MVSPICVIVKPRFSSVLDIVDTTRSLLTVDCLLGISVVVWDFKREGSLCSYAESARRGISCYCRNRRDDCPGIPLSSVNTADSITREGWQSRAHPVGQAFRLVLSLLTYFSLAEDVSALGYHDLMVHTG